MPRFRHAAHTDARRQPHAGEPRWSAAHAWLLLSERCARSIDARCTVWTPILWVARGKQSMHGWGCRAHCLKYSSTFSTTLSTEPPCASRALASAARSTTLAGGLILSFMACAMLLHDCQRGFGRQAPRFDLALLHLMPFANRIVSTGAHDINVGIRGSLGVLHHPYRRSVWLT